MEIKKCTKCTIEKDISNFSKNGNTLRSQCKDCINIKNKLYYINNKQSIILHNQKYYRENYQSEYNKQKEYIINNDLQVQQCTKCNIIKEYKYFSKSKIKINGIKSKCKECAKIENAQHYENNKELYHNMRQKYYKNNKRKILDKNNEYFIANTNTIIQYRAKYQKTRRANDPLYKLCHTIRTLICGAFKKKNIQKLHKSESILCCTFEQFKEHLEQQFDDKMNWDNQGTYWELDHIKPVSLATNEQELLALNHYTNFQPLFWRDNIMKSNKYIGN